MTNDDKIVKYTSSSGKYCLCQVNFLKKEMNTQQKKKKKTKKKKKEAEKRVLREE